MPRHERTIDLSAVTNLEQRAVLQNGLDAVSYPLGRIRKNTGRKVPVRVSDLSRYMNEIDEVNGAHGHVHRNNDALGETQHGHLLAARHAPLGLYWLPTKTYPAGQIEIHRDTFLDPDLAREVLIAELAHAVDYGVPMTDQQRYEIAKALHGGEEPYHEGHGWFEERGENDYWSWPGENFMAIFMRAYAPKLPRPLEAHQPWVHKTTQDVVRVARRVLRKPASVS